MKFDVFLTEDAQRDLEELHEYITEPSLLSTASQKLSTGETGENF